MTDSAIPEIDADELERRLLDGATLIDVREPDEYEEAHAPGAVLIPLATVPDELAQFPRDGEVLMICASGGRSGRATEWLRAQGVDAVNVAGGTLGWIAAGKPTVSGSSPS
jgi:rhodanese-related sulfurtransferase